MSVEGEQEGVEREHVNRKESEQILKVTMHCESDLIEPFPSSFYRRGQTELFLSLLLQRLQ